MKLKYQIKSKEGIATFDKKEDFLKRCRLEFSANRKGSIQYSFDYGDTWSYILNFPNDRQTIESQKKYQNENRNYSKKSESKLGQYRGVPNWVFIILTPLILIGVYFYTNQNIISRTENTIETIKHEDYSSDEINDERKTEQNSESYINPDISSELDANEIIRILEFDDNSIKKIKIVLSARDYDSENKHGSFCSDGYVKCKYCSSSFSTPQNFKSVNSAVSFFFYNTLYTTGIKLSLTETNRSEYREAIMYYCNLYLSGVKYTCELPMLKKEFCSKKCENEYEWNN